MTKTQTNLENLFNDENIVEGGIWIPTEIGEQISGIVLETGESRFGNYCIIGDKDGNAIQTPAHKALMAKLIEVQVNDLLGIRYEGSTPSQYDKPTQLYTVFHKKSDK